jgi:regulator of protease activity HflC (stomatin/prohibitin superfamily)
MNLANLFGGIATIAWLVAIAVVVMIVLQSARSQPIKNGVTLIVIVIIGAVVLSTVSAGLVFINPQERGVVISAINPAGYRSDALTPGLRWIVPFAEGVITYPISKQTYTMSGLSGEGQVVGDDAIEARTSDGQQVKVDSSIIFSINPTEVVDVHITWQDRYDTDLVRALARGVIRDAVSQYGIEEVYSSKRNELATEITGELELKLVENGLLLDDFVLRNISFSPEYAASVEQKQIAEQAAQQAKFVVEQRFQEAEQARQVAEGKADAAVIESSGRAKAVVIEAEAEAEALELIAAALLGKEDLLTYQYINQITPNVQVMFLPADAPFLFPLPDLQTVQPPVTEAPTSSSSAPPAAAPVTDTEAATVTE